MWRSYMKKMWQMTYAYLGRSKAKSPFPDFFEDKSKSYLTPTRIANGFNEFFAEIGPQLAAKFNVDDEHIIYAKEATQTFKFREINLQDTLKIIEGMKRNVAVALMTSPIF